MSITSKPQNKNWDDNYDRIFKKPRVYKPGPGDICGRCGRPARKHIRDVNHDEGVCPES
jgi:hypothetical protein